MIDPIYNDDVKRRRRMEEYQEYQNSLDDVEDDSSQIRPPGKMEGKSVKKLEHDPLIGNIFRNSFD